MRIFSTCAPRTFVGETYVVACTAQCILGVFLVGVIAIPSKRTDAQVFCGHYPQSTNQILVTINILVVGALTVVNTHLVVQQSMAVIHWQQVSLHLKTDVATVRPMFSDAVVEALQFHGNL